MELRELRIYVEVVNAGGLSAAARHLHLSQSTISETVIGLERQLGVTLLLRSRAGVTPTEAGERLAAGARELLRRHDQLVADVTSRDEETAHIRIGLPLELPGEFVQTLVANLHRDNPDVRIDPVHASTAGQWDELDTGRLDLALVRELRPSGHHDSALVVEEAMGVVLPTGHPALADGQPVRLDRLPPLRWSGFPRSDSPRWYDHVVSVLRAHGVHVPDPDPDEHRPVIPDVKLAAVGAGAAFALAAPGFRIPDGLEWRPLAGDPVVRRTWVVWRASSTSRDIAVVVAALENQAVVR